MLEGGLGTLVTYNPQTVYPHSTLEDVLPHFDHQVIRHLPVVDDQRRVVGMLSGHDVKRLMSRSQDSKPWSLSVRDMMTDGAFTVNHNAPALAALALMLKHHVHSAPVVENDQLVGIVTSSDFLRELLYGNSTVGNHLVSVYMQETYEWFQAGSPAAAALRTLRSLGAEYAVVQRDTTPLGVLSRFDLGELGVDESLVVGDFLIEVSSLKPSDNLVAAARRMLEYAAPAVPVENQEHGLVGLLTQDDMLHAMAE